MCVCAHECPGPNVRCVQVPCYHIANSNKMWFNVMKQYFLAQVYYSGSRMHIDRSMIIIWVLLWHLSKINEVWNCIIIWPIVGIQTCFGPVRLSVHYHAAVPEGRCGSPFTSFIPPGCKISWQMSQYALPVALKVTAMRFILFSQHPLSSAKRVLTFSYTLIGLFNVMPKTHPWFIVYYHLLYLRVQKWIWTHPHTLDHLHRAFSFLFIVHISYRFLFSQLN